MIVAIDGPAGSGKSTVAQEVGAALNLRYLDSGALYRTLTVWVMSCLMEEAGGPSQAYCWDENQRQQAEKIHKAEIDAFLRRPDFAKLLENLNFRLDFLGDIQQMWISDQNVSDTIRLPEVTRNIGRIANFGPCRERVNSVLRDFGAGNDVIIDGRDIGTEVFPNAHLKIYLDASVEIRAARRHAELREKGIEMDIDQLQAEIATRDEADQNRDLAPLRKADDAFLIDTSNLSKNDVFGLIVEKINRSRTT